MEIPLFKVRMKDQVLRRSSNTLKSGWVGQGVEVEIFESRLSDYIGNPLINTVNSATSGIHLALHSLKTEGRDEVLTTSVTCMATNLPIIHNGLKAKWVDMDPSTMNMDLEDLRSKISEKTLCIMIVHWGGHPVDLNKLSEIQDECESKYGFRPVVIEDCAHAFGSAFDGKRLGNHGNICVYSFQAIKHLTTVDGGAIISPNKDHYERIKKLRWYGLDRNGDRLTQNVIDAGFKFHMNDLNATIGIANIKDIDDDIKKHQRNGFHLSCYSIVNGLRRQTKLRNSVSSYWFYTILVENRSSFVKHMNSKGVEVRQAHSRNDTSDCFGGKADLPSTKLIDEQMVQIPCGWWVSESEINYIADCISEGW